MRKLTALLAIICLLSSFSLKKDHTWVAIGDSITYMDAHPEEAGNRITKGYMTMVAEKLPNIHFINQGHNGWTTGGIANSIETLNIEKADIYSILLGTNDWWHGGPLGTLKDYTDNTGNNTSYGAYRTIINKIRSLNPDAKIILITPVQRGDFVYLKSYTNNAYGSYKDKNGHTLSEYADAVKAIAKIENLTLVDLYYKSRIKCKNAVKYKRLKNPQTGEYQNYTYPEYTTIPFNPATDEYPYPMDAMDMTYDGLHPSEKGMAVIAKMLVKVMKKY
jgi:lysophospholipase L1-like esterase